MTSPHPGLTRRHALMGLGVGALALAGCTADPGSGAGDGTITMWGSWSGEQIGQLEKQIAAFNAAQSEIEVRYEAQELVEQKLLTAIAGGGVPDIVLWDRYQTAVYAAKGALAPLGELVERDGVDLGAFYQPPVSEMTVDGTLYGLPLLVDNRSLFYNRELLTEAGLTPPGTWTELADAAEELTVRENGRLKRAGLMLDDPGLFNIWLLQAGGSLLGADGKSVGFNSDAGRAVLDFWDDLLRRRKVFELGFGDGVDAFAQRNAAFKYDGPWALSTYDAVDGLSYGVVPPVTGAAGTGAITGGFGLVIPEGAPNREAAWTFAKWWTTNAANGVDFARISGWIPATVAAAKDPFFTEDEHYAAFITAMDYAQVRPTVTGYADVEALALLPALEKFMAGELSAAEALAQAETQGNQILGENA
ncbi:ABC transporter substrate-binding protein [Phytomonospora endophytica]|uniref:Multiple sugar transport system substrate-binding protein n=1 Tax=Phytomonospora endophytica TaxID=714109 RepID=A0A841FJX0_9ACTN|nr:ABC transporter substrate-binding protein [Phytomonospora endophytica]MBB6033447.1 multiple sugar transport system substrate-binding protein [Phytomonospora endophytica]GIG65034.1 sugar ABC transporter substrate-binding protein [Phytomonospora endophytica]